MDEDKVLKVDSKEFKKLFDIKLEEDILKNIEDRIKDDPEALAELNRIKDEVKNVRIRKNK